MTIELSQKLFSDKPDERIEAAQKLATQQEEDVSFYICGTRVVVSPDYEIIQSRKKNLEENKRIEKEDWLYERSMEG